jgi:hypothetical protein
MLMLFRELNTDDFEGYTALISTVCGKNTEPLIITGDRRLIIE